MLHIPVPANIRERAIVNAALAKALCREESEERQCSYRATHGSGRPSTASQTASDVNSNLGVFCDPAE
jgi:hypothetical protein